MTFQPNILVFSLLSNFICCFGIAIYSWRKTYTSYQKYFTLLMLMIAVWSLAGAFESAATSLDTKLIFSKIEYIVALTAPVFYLKFAAGFSKVDEIWKKFYAWFWMVPLLIFIAALTNEHHHLIWTGFSWSSAGNNIIIYHHGPLFFLATVFSLGMILLSQVLLFKALKRLPELSRKQAKLFILASYFPFIAVGIYSFEPSFLVGLDIIILSFSFTGILLLVGIVRYNILDIVPIVKQHITSIIPDGLLVLDHHRHLIFSNEVATKLLESQYGKLKHNISVVDWLVVAVDSFIEEGLEKKEVTIQDKNEEWYNVMLSRLVDRAGKLRGIVIIMRNISQRKKLEIEAEVLNRKIFESNKALIELNAQKDKILSIIGHDLKTSFHQISAFTLIIKENAELFNKTNILELVSDIDTAAQNGNKVLEDLLLWAQGQQKAASVNPSSFNFNELIEEVMLFFGKLTETKKLKIENRFSSNVIVYADRNMVTVVLRNIISNAIKFSHTGDTITLDWQKPDSGHVNILIIDQGKGMSTEQMSKLFNPEIKFSTTGTAGEKGNGLGLALSYDMMLRNKGNIQVESTPGKGTKFILTLPVEAAETPAKVRLSDSVSLN